LTDKDNTY